MPANRRRLPLLLRLRLPLSWIVTLAAGLTAGLLDISGSGASGGFGGAHPLAAQRPGFADGNRPVAPFRIAGNVYYVGAADITSYLIDCGPSGLILLDGGLPETAAQIRDNVGRLGRSLRDVKFLLNSHAHFDHAGGLAQLKAWSGAEIVASAADAPTLLAGGRGDATLGNLDASFPPVSVDRIVRDGEKVGLGATTLTAHLTPGHTPGDTTWTLQVTEGGRRYEVVFVGGVSVLSNFQLLKDPTYPGIADDFAHSFAVLRSLPCDIFLGAHASFFHGAEKARRLAAGEQPNPFIDPQGYRQYVDGGEAIFRQRLAAEKAAAP